MEKGSEWFMGGLKFNWKKGIIISMVLLSVLFISSFSMGTVSAVVTNNIYVNATSGNDSYDGASPIWTGGTNGPKLTIGNATTTLTDNGTVNIANGLYKGKLNRNITITKNITLLGENRDSTIIDAEGMDRIFTINSGVNVNILKLTLKNGNSDYGGAINSQGALTVTESSFTNNNGTMGGAICNYDTLTVNSCDFTLNTATSNGKAIYNEGGDSSSRIVNYNRFYDTATGYEIYSSSGSMNTMYNWWGSNSNPISKVYGTVTVSPWLVLNVTANPTLIQIGNTSNITAKLLHDSSGGYHPPASGHVPDGMLVTFATTLGTINSPLSTLNGTANATLNGGAVRGVSDINATFDNQTVQTSVTIVDTIPPTINTIDPANNAVNVASNKVITVTFNENVKGGNLDLVQLKNSTGTLIPTTKNISGNTLTITPTTPLAEAKYLLLLYAGCVTDLADNPVASKTSNFIVGSSPTVTSTDPSNYAVNVASNKVITVTFNEAIKAGNNNIQLKTSTGTVIPITKSISGNTLTITPTNPLAEARYIILIYAGSVTDLVGNPVAAKTTSFSTGNSPYVTGTDPLNYAVNVAPNKVITATFNEPILAKYLTLIYLKTTTGIAIPTTKSVSGTTLTITPTSALTAGTKYLLLIYTFAVTDLVGNPNVNKAISFTVNTSTAKLLFIHHSCGSNWLSTGNGNLGTTLNSNNYYVSESDYGWSAEPGDSLGDRTNTNNWPEWFTDAKMPYVYASDYHSAYTNTISNPGGENEIIMFKSCYPCSEVGSSIDDEKAIYNSLLTYFAAHPNKFFVLITPPGETNVASYQLTRDLCNWLVDNNTGWLSGYSTGNVMVFDLYGVLSEVNSHHRWVTDHVEHVYASNYDGTSPYHNGDDHPNSTGNQKATNEFMSLLNHFYNEWKT